jgi:hypothetical protein
MLIALTAFALWLGWWVNSARNQEAAIQSLHHLDHYPSVTYDNEDHSLSLHSGTFHSGGALASISTATPQPKWWVPEFLEQRFSRDFLYNVVGVSYGQVARFNRLSPSEQRSVYHKLSRLGHLQSFTCYVPVCDADLVQLARSPSLKNVRLEVPCPELTDDGLRDLSRVGPLESLSIAYAPITDAGLAHLRDSRRLTSLALPDIYATRRTATPFNISDCGLACLEGLTELRAISLHSDRITGQGLNRLPANTQLRALNLQCPQIADDDLRHLASLKNLSSLYLVNSRIAGTGFRHLTSSKLSLVQIASPHVGDEAIESLAKLPELETLRIDSDNLTVRGLRQLSAAPKLKLLLLRSSVSDAEISALKQSMPRCTIYNDRVGRFRVARP